MAWGGGQVKAGNLGGKEELYVFTSTLAGVQLSSLGRRRLF